MKIPSILALSVASLVICVTTAAPGQAASTQLVHEIQSVNAQMADKNYQQAIPHAELAVALAQKDASVTAAQRIELLNVLAQLYYLESNYPSAERATRQVLDLRRADGSDVHAIAVSEEDLAELLDLQGKFGAAEPLHASAAAALQTILRGAPAASSALGTRNASPILESVFDFYDTRNNGEEPGYGRYTYVILTSNKERAEALLASLVAAPAGATVAKRNRAVVNAFEIPVTAGQRQAARERSVPRAAGDNTAKADAIWSLYDFAAANNLLLAACKSENSTATKACHDVGAGPYLITFTHPAGAYNTLPSPYLIVDMSNMQTLAFPYIVKTMQAQLEAHDVADIHDAGGIHSTQTGLINTVLVAKDWLGPVSDSVGQWLKLVPVK